MEVVKHLTTYSRRKYTNINCRTENKERTILMLAAISGNVDLVQYIIDTEWCQAIDYEAVDSKGSTVLMLATAAGYSNIVQKLCEAGADVNSVNHGTGYNALMLASQYGHHETAGVLMERAAVVGGGGGGGGQVVGARDHQGRNALFLAAQWNQPECVRVILEKTQSRDVINAVTHNGTMTPLTATYDPEIRLQLIQAKGCDVRSLSDKQHVLRLADTNCLIYGKTCFPKHLHNISASCAC